MKNKFINKGIFAIILCFGLFTACEDATEILQVGELNEETAFRTIDDVRSGMYAAYSNYGPDFGGNDSGVDVIYFNAIFTDNVKRGIDNAGQGIETYDFDLQPGSDTPRTIWANRYGTINSVNRVLRAIGNIEFAEEDMAELNHIKAQLLGLRAIAHFDIFQYYTIDYQDPTDLAAYLLDFVPTIEIAFERNTVAETLAFIKNDMNTAASLFDPALSAANGNIFINADFIKALRARVALAEGDYPTAKTLSAELVADYPIASTTQYPQMFLDVDNTEVIFKLSRVQNDNAVAGLWYFNSPDITGSPYIEMSNGLLNEFDLSDVRRAVNVGTTSVIAGQDNPDNVILINKYPGSGDGTLVNDIKLFRSSEFLLIRAECEARNNQLTDAANSIQQLRASRYLGAPPTTPVFNSMTEALTEVLNERRKELCFEGHRYLDLKRLGGELNIGVNRNPVDCASFSASCSLPANNYRFTLPIPTAEIEGNAVISQNPNY